MQIIYQNTFRRDENSVIDQDFWLVKIELKIEDNLVLFVVYNLLDVPQSLAPSSPLLERLMTILKSTPFCIAFELRVRIFKMLVELDKKQYIYF